MEILQIVLIVILVIVLIYVIMWFFAKSTQLTRMANGNVQQIILASTLSNVMLLS